jgi:hypothetical protein
MKRSLQSSSKTVSKARSEGAAGGGARRCALALAAGVGVALAGGAARGDVKNYISPVNSSWQSGAAWSPLGAPTTFDHLVFDRTLPSFITFDTATNSCFFHTYRRNTVNVDVVGLHVVTGGMIVGNIANSATLNLRQGTLAVNAGSSLGSVNGGHGILRLEEPNVEFSVNGASSTLRVGVAGAGDVFLNQGSVLRCDGPVIVADQATSSAAVHLTGVSPNLFGRTTEFEVNGAGSTVTIGNAGTGFLNIADRAQVNLSGDLVVGALPGSSGRINGLGGVLRVGGDLRIGANTTGAASGDGLAILDTMLVSLGGAIRVGDPNGGDGELRIDGGANVTCRGLILAFNRATFSLLDGSIGVIGGGQFAPLTTNLALNAKSATAEATMQFNGAAPVSVLGSLQAGTTTRGRLEVFDGSVTFLGAGGGVSTLGQAAAAVGELRVGVSGVVEMGSGTLNVGQLGTGAVLVETEGALNVGTLNLGAGAGSTGTLTIELSGEVNVGTGGVAIGGTATAAGGDASVTINNGRLISGGGVLLHAGRTMALSGAIVTVGGEVGVRGPATMATTTITAPTLAVSATGSITGHGTISARVSGAGSVTAGAAGTVLNLGSSGSTTGVAMTGPLSVGAGTVQLRDADVASVVSLSGFGTVACDYQPGSGGISATGAGLTFGGRLTNPLLAAIGGTRFTFNGTGSFEGRGTIGAPVTSLGGSLIRGTNNLTLGSAASTTGAALNGDLHTGGFTMTLLDSNSASLGGRVDLAGGTVACSTGFSVQQPATIVGPGAMSGAVQSAGIIDCLNLGILHTTLVTQSYSQAAAGRLLVSVFASGSATNLSVAGAASLNGTLTVRANFEPTENQRWTVLTAASRTGEFDSVQFPPVARGGFGVTYVGNRVEVFFCLAEFNGDGVVNPDDLADFIAGFFSQPPLPETDFDGNGIVNPDDLADYIAVFFGGCA